jgi:hypothetical protein
MWLNAAVLGGDTPWIGGGSALRLTGEMYSTFIPCSAKCTAHCKDYINDIIPQPKTFSWQSLYIHSSEVHKKHVQKAYSFIANIWLDSSVKQFSPGGITAI